MEQNRMESWAPAIVTAPRDPLRGQLLESQTRVRETCWALLPSALASRRPWSLVSLLSQPSQTLHHQSLSPIPQWPFLCSFKFKESVGL